MSVELDEARRVANAILFEGYLLYPYRASAPKNQVRWQFGVLAPPGTDTGDPGFSQTECLVEPGAADTLEITVRFLQVQRRSGPVPWDEGVVQEVLVTARLDESTVDISFEVPGGEDVDGDVVRQRQPLQGVIRVAVTRIEGPYGLLKVRVRVENATPAKATDSRADLLPYSMVATHSLLGLPGGSFVSLLEPPHWAAGAAASCQNLHTWPVLIGKNHADAMLSSPIILYDYPEVAAESPADLFDATEIDEILTLRTMALTDEEKREARATDPRAAALVDRIDAMPPEVLDQLHGTMRRVKTTTPEPLAFDTPAVPWWDPGADSSVSPETDGLMVDGGRVARGSRVRLRPSTQGTDAQDMFLRGRLATVEAVLFDVDGTGHLAVTLDGDEAGGLYGRFRYFAPEEVELA
jgi:hypothetical protein